MSKTDFQDGSCGGHLGFPNGIILAIFDLEVILLVQCKFQLKSPNCLGGEVKNCFFLRGRLWWPFWISSWHDFSYFSSTHQPVATS